MADAYGTIVVCGDYEGDLNAVVSILNSLDFGDYPQFQVHRDEREGRVYIHLSYDHVQYPTLFPRRELYVLKDGRRVFAEEADESVVLQWEAENGDFDFVEYSLGELSSLISAHLTKGTLEFVAVAHEKCREAYHERLVIRSDGSAERHRSISEIYSTTAPWTHIRSEYCDPSDERQAA
jgi:hypothetical protein